MKKFNQYILTHYPLIWNTRFHIMLPLLLLLNGIFFFAGFQTDYTLQTLSDWRYDHSVTANSIAVLTGIVLLIVWLLFYFRQNAFKKLLPLSTGHLAKELVIILLVFAGLCSFMVSYQIGRNLKLKSISRNLNVKKEYGTIALAMHFLPFSADDFSKNEEGKNAEFSYLNYNGRYSYYYNSEERSNAETKATKMLLSGNKDAVKTAINQYLLLCKKYGAKYNINVDAHVNSIFSTPDFKLKGTLIEDGDSADNYRFYIDRSIVDRAVSTLENSDNGLDKEVYYFLYYAVIMLSVAVFSFRVTAVRTWLIAVVSCIVLAIIVSIFAIANDFREAGIFGAMLALAVAAFVIAVINILSQKHKQAGGVCYTLFLWFLPAFIMVFYGFIKELLRHSFYDGRNDELYTWLRENVILCNVIGGVFSLLMIFFIMIPLVKKWQANPQE